MSEAELQKQVGALFILEKGPNAPRIRTPFLFPDGEIIDLYLTHDGGRLSDMGRTRDYTHTHMMQEAFIDQRKLLRDLGMTYGVQWEHGVLYLPVTDAQSVAKAVLQLATACVAFVHVVIGQT